MKNLRKLIIIRHGHYDNGSESLSKYGKEQCKATAGNIARLTREFSKIQIFTSDLPRSIETGEIVASELRIDEVKSLFDLRTEHYHSREEVYPVIEKRIKDETELVIIVAHFEMPSGLVCSFINKKFGKELDPSISQNAKGYLCCMHTGSVSTI